MKWAWTIRFAEKAISKNAAMCLLPHWEERAINYVLQYHYSHIRRNIKRLALGRSRDDECISGLKMKMTPVSINLANKNKKNSYTRFRSLDLRVAII